MDSQSTLLLSHSMGILNQLSATCVTLGKRGTASILSLSDGVMSMDSIIVTHLSPKRHLQINYTLTPLSLRLLIKPDGMISYAMQGWAGQTISGSLTLQDLQRGMLRSICLSLWRVTTSHHEQEKFGIQKIFLNYQISDLVCDGKYIINLTGGKKEQSTSLNMGIKSSGKI